MKRISIKYTATHELYENEKYVFCKRKCFNLKTGKELSRQYKKGSEGFFIDGVFMTLNKIRPKLRKIANEENLPF